MSNPTLSLVAVKNQGSNTQFTFSIAATGEGAERIAEASLDYGDGSAPESVTLVPDGSGGATGSARHNYPVASGQRKYTATARAGVPGAVATWAQLVAARKTWADVVAAYPTWGDLASSITATAEATTTVGDGQLTVSVPQAGSPAIDVTMWLSPEGKTPARRSLLRRDLGGNGGGDLVIWSAGDGGPTGVGYVIRDYQAPLSNATAYVLTVTYTDGSTAEFTSPTITVSAEDYRGCWITSLITGDTMPVTVQSWDTWQWGTRNVAVAVADREDPVILSDKPVWPASTVVLRTRSPEDFARLEAIILSGRILLRTQGTSSLPTTYAATGEYQTTRLVASDGASWLMQHGVNLQRIKPTPGTAGRPVGTRA